MLAISEIESQYEAEWVLVEDPEVNEALEVLGGRVLYHSKDRDEFDRKALEFKPRHFAVLFTGQPSEEMELAL